MLGGGRRKGVEARRMRACVTTLGPMPALGLSSKCVLAILILGATVAGGNGGSGGGWRSQWVHPIGARAQVHWLRSERTFVSIGWPRSGLRKTPRVGLHAQNVATGSCSRANCELCAWGSTPRGIRRGQSEKRWPQTVICESSA